MGIFNFFGIDVEVDLTGKEYEEDVRLGNRYLELHEQTKDFDREAEELTEEQEALDREQTDVFCKLAYERNVRFDWGREEEQEESKPWWKVW